MSMSSCRRSAPLGRCGWICDLQGSCTPLQATEAQEVSVARELRDGRETGRVYLASRGGDGSFDEKLPAQGDKCASDTFGADTCIGARKLLRYSLMVEVEDRRLPLLQHSGISCQLTCPACGVTVERW